MSHNIDFLPAMADLCKSMGVWQLNLHRVSLIGNALSNAGLSVHPDRWLKRVSCLSEYLHLQERFACDINQCSSLTKDTDCSWNQVSTTIMLTIVSMERNRGTVSSCTPIIEFIYRRETFGTDSYIGSIEGGKFVPNVSPTNELKLFINSVDPSISDVSTRQIGSDSYPRVLSVSYKRTIRV